MEERPGLAALAHRKNLPEQGFGFLAIEEMRLVGRMFVGVRNKAVYFALGVQADRMKDILGLWIENTEGAKFWLRVMRTS